LNDPTTDPFAAAEAAATHLRGLSPPPTVAIVLGSGLGAFTERLEDALSIPYEELPGFPSVGVAGHSGTLVVGRLPGGGPRVAGLAGRVHLYEGHAPAVVVHPTRTLARWGVRSLVLTNAAGGINPEFSPGDLMLITDHLNFSGHSPLTGPNEARFGPRFPDMTQAYDAGLCDALRGAAAARELVLREGVYCGLAGPAYETPAEIRAYRVMGADAVGMSTVNEVIAARHAGLRVAGISCITNLASGLGHEVLDHADVEEVARQAREAFVSLLTEGLARIHDASGGSDA
jgi:purine-nucleoside phosphorylase